MIDYYTGQFREVCDIFYDAVHGTAAAAYSPEQLAAWAPLPRPYAAWRWRCELRRPFLFRLEGAVAGFLELDSDGRIDCLYTDPRFGRRGVASALLKHAVEVALANDMARLRSEASHLARGLFEKHGFRVLRANTAVCRGVPLANWLMDRTVP